MEGIAKIDFSQKSCFMDFGHERGRFVEVLGAVFLVFCVESKQQQLLPGLAASGPQPEGTWPGEGTAHPRAGVTESIL